LAYDNYWENGYNFFLYSHPARGFLFVPNDMDQAFPSRPPSNPSLASIWPPSLQFPANVVLADPVWREKFEERVLETARAFEVDAFEERLDLWRAQIRPSALEDPFIAGSFDSRF